MTTPLEPEVGMKCVKVYRSDGDLEAAPPGYPSVWLRSAELASVSPGKSIVASPCPSVSTSMGRKPTRNGSKRQTGLIDLANCVHECSGGST
jgi:hypothetical protein